MLSCVFQYLLGVGINKLVSSTDILLLVRGWPSVPCCDALFDPLCDSCCTTRLVARLSCDQARCV